MTIPQEQSKAEFDSEIWSCRQSLVNVACRIVYDRETAEDIVQDSYVAALSARDKFNGAASPKTWIYRIVINKSLDVRRKNFQRRTLLELITMNTVIDHRGGPPDYEGDGVVIRRELDRIPETLRMPFLLCEIDEFTYAEIADSLQISLNAVRTRIFRCRKMLQKNLRKAGISL